jgi:predicted transcriptional regulator
LDAPNNANRILLFIQQNPGCHLREIKRELNLSMGTIQYHINLLEKDGRILSERRSLHRFYFPVGIFDENQKNVLKILHQDTAREILLYIIERDNPTQTDIAESIKISHASINWHLQRLLSLGLIDETREGKYKKYQFIGNRNLLVKLLQNYHPSLWNKWSNRLAEMFLSLSKEDSE